MYRSLSVALYGSESQHAQLRLDNALHFADNYSTIFGISNLLHYDIASIGNQARVMRTDKEWAGEVAIKSAAVYLQRDIEFYTSATNEPPLTYHPAPRPACYQPLNFPLRIALFEPGYYRAVTEQHQRMAIDVSSAHHCVCEPGNGPNPVHQLIT
jgi:hypothetical protein